jgi:hypothetical protein
VKPEVSAAACWKAIGVLVPLTLLVGLAGCDAFDSGRKPYTPFPTASGSATPPPAALVTAPRVDAGRAREAASISRGALLAPSDARDWRIAERKLTAPDGLVFRLGLVGGLAGGKDGDVLAWLIGTPDKPVIGELWLFPEDGPPRLISGAPGFLPTGPTCSHDAHLDQTGPNSVALDIRASCAAPLLPRTPDRSVAVLAPLRDNPKIVGFRLAAPAPGEAIHLEVVSRDRDSDGRDDVEMTVVFAAAPAPEIRASFVWLDRPAGLSRDAFEPLASFVRLASLETKRASGPKAESVAEGVANARRLYSTLCAESGVARISLENGTELSCGDLSAAFQSFTLARVNAELGAGHPERALAALEQHAWFPSGAKAEADRFGKAQLALVMAKVIKRRVIKLVPLKAVPRRVEAEPHLSPLSFHADGSLLLLTAEGLVRAAPDGRFEYDASSEVDAWNTAVVSSKGERLRGVAFPCDRSEVSWLATDGAGNVLPPIPTPLVAPRPGVCRSGGAFIAPRITANAWTTEGISAFLGSSLLGAPPAHPPMGSAVSPNGRFSAVATESGLLVFGNDKTTLWVFDDPELARQLEDCVVSNNAQAAACLLGGRAQVILPDPKTG